MSSGVLADVATGGAGFRDEFYAVARAVVECDEAAPGDGRVVTSGLIDPAWCRWGQCTARIGGAVWLRPGLDRSRLDAVGRRWVEARRGPKVLVASQTRVIEAVVDPSGDLVPITPVVSLHPRDGVDPWLVAAALSSPAASRWLAGRRGGSGLSSGSIRVSVGDLLACPLPADREAWRVGAALFRSAQETPPGPEHDGLLVRFGTTMLAAGPIGANERDWDEWGGIDGIMSWWVQGLPRRSGTG